MDRQCRLLICCESPYEPASLRYSPVNTHLPSFTCCHLRQNPNRHHRLYCHLSLTQNTTPNRHYASTAERILSSFERLGIPASPDRVLKVRSRPSLTSKISPPSPPPRVPPLSSISLLCVFPSISPAMSACTLCSN
jgi:hypothetical protein